MTGAENTPPGGTTSLVETSFEDFKPRAYLEEYFSEIDNEIVSLYEFFRDAYNKIGPHDKMLEFGGGPTIYQLVTASLYAREIHFSDYVDANVDEVKQWQIGQEGHFDWTPFVKLALQTEGIDSPTAEQIQERQDLIRSKITKYAHADAYQPNPLSDLPNQDYDVVSVNFVPEGITQSIESWSTVIDNILSLAKKHGYLLLSSVTGADYWKSGERNYMAVSMSHEDIVTRLQQKGMEIVFARYITAHETDRSSPDYSGYQGMSFVLARKLA